jgi:hypothetical protein
MGRDDWQIDRTMLPAEPIPLQESCVERQHVRRRVTNFKNAIQ